MNNLKIAMLSDSFFPIRGGREYAIDHLSKEFSKDNICCIAAPKMKNSEIPSKSENRKIFRCNSIRLSKSAYVSIVNNSFKKEFERINYDIIHLQTKYLIANYAFHLRKKYNIPIITTAHTNYLELYRNQIKLPFIRKIALKRVLKVLNNSDCVVTVSNYMKNMLKTIGCTNQIEVIPNGCDLKYPENPQLLIDKINKLYNLKNVENFLLFVGRLCKSKNFDYLLSVLNLYKDLFDTNFLLIAVGDGNLNKYQSKIFELGLSQNIKILGQLNERELLQALYLRADLHICPSTIESFGMTIQEAASQKTPSLVIENIVTADKIIDCKNGYITSIDTFKFANKIKSILCNKANLLSAGESAYATFKFSWEDVKERHVHLYNEIIKKYKER